MKKGLILFLAITALLFYGSLSSAQTETPVKEDAAMGQTDVHSGMHEDMMMRHQGEPMGGCRCGKSCGCAGCSMREGGMGCGMMGGMMRPGMMGCRTMGGGVMGPGMMGRGMRGMMGGMAGHRHMRHLLMQLGLNEKQRTEIFGIHDSVAKDMIRKRAELQIAKLELKELLRREPLDLAAADAKVRQIQNIKTDMFISFLKTKEQVKTVLTPEQRKRLRDMETGVAMMDDDDAMSNDEDEEDQADED